MRVERVFLKNFRNIQEETFCPDPGINYLIGLNGQGKTSFIEALYFLSTLKSFRGIRPSFLIQKDKQIADISCSLSEDKTEKCLYKPLETNLRIFFERGVKEATSTQVAFINGKAVPSATQYLSHSLKTTQKRFHSIVFNPFDSDLIRGTPAVRRHYLDKVLSGENLHYLDFLKKYKRILEQRNALLKQYQNKDSDTLFGFTKLIVQYGSTLAIKRLEWLEKAKEPFERYLKKIAPNQAPVKISYLSDWVPPYDHLSRQESRSLLESAKFFEDAFLKKIGNVEQQEKKTGYTWVGPHRDDFIFSQGASSLEKLGSQGEIRSVLLALKLTELELFRNETNCRPLFLLDDFSLELDSERRSFLLDFLLETDLQTFITTTEDFLFSGKRFWVKNGKIKEGNA